MTDEKKVKILVTIIAILSLLCAFLIGEIVCLKTSKPDFRPPVEFKRGPHGFQMGHDKCFKHPEFKGHKMHETKKFDEKAKQKFDEKRKKMIEKFDKELGLTKEQKAKIEANHEKSKKQMQEIMTQEKKLKEQKKAIMEQNKKDFEAILTDEQKEKLHQMHENHKKKFEGKFPRDFKGRGPEGFRPNPDEIPEKPQGPDIDD